MPIAIFVRFSIFGWFSFLGGGLLFCFCFFSLEPPPSLFFPVNPTWFSRYSEGNRAREGGSFPKSSLSLQERPWDPRARPDRTRSRRGASSRSGRERSEPCAAAGAAPLPPRAGPTNAGTWLKNISFPGTRKTAISGSKGVCFSGENMIAAAPDSAPCAAGESPKIPNADNVFFHFCSVPSLVYHTSFGFTPDLLRFIPDVAPCRLQARSAWKTGTAFH